MKKMNCPVKKVLITSSGKFQLAKIEFDFINQHMTIVGTNDSERITFKTKFLPHGSISTMTCFPKGLTRDETIQNIRSIAKSTHLSQTSIAMAAGCSQSTVSKILNSCQ